MSRVSLKKRMVVNKEQHDEVKAAVEVLTSALGKRFSSKQDGEALDKIGDGLTQLCSVKSAWNVIVEMDSQDKLELLDLINQLVEDNKIILETTPDTPIGCSLRSEKLVLGIVQYLLESKGFYPYANNTTIRVFKAQ